MRWRYVFAEEAKKQVDRLAPKVRERILRFLDERVATEHHPRRLAVKLTGNNERWRFRVGDYRLIATFEERVLTVEIVEVGNRRNVYERRR